MVSIEQVKAGIAGYLDEEFVQKLSGWQKWVFGAGAAMLLSDADALVERLKGSELLQMMQVFDGQNIDVEKLYPVFKAQAAKGDAVFQMPMIGMVTMTEKDVDSIYNHIMRGA